MDKVRAELANYKEFAALSEQIVEVNEAICEGRAPAPAAGGSPARQAGKKGALRGASRPRSAAEIARLSAVAARSLAAGTGWRLWSWRSAPRC